MKEFNILFTDYILVEQFYCLHINYLEYYFKDISVFNLFIDKYPRGFLSEFTEI